MRDPLNIRRCWRAKFGLSSYWPSSRITTSRRFLCISTLDRKPPTKSPTWKSRETKAARRGAAETAARGRPDGHEDRARHTIYTVEEEEQHHRQQGGDSPNPSAPNLAVHFANLTNAILRGIKDGGTKDRFYNKFMPNSKKQLIFDLKRAYNELYNFYTDPSRMMPDWLSVSPPAKSFCTSEMDGRLLSKEYQIKQELRAFAEGLRFVCLEVRHCSVFAGFRVSLRLDFATVLTKDARQHVKRRLLPPEGFRNDQNFSSGPSRGL